MAVLNLLVFAFFALFGLFDADGDGDGGEGGGKPGDKPDPADADDDQPDDKTDFKAEAAKWKALSRKHEAEAKRNAGAAQRLKDAEDADKSELEKANERATAADRRAADAELNLLRVNVAADKGLSSVQAKRLVGATREELEADAEELLAAFSSKNGKDDSDKDPLRRPDGKPRSGSVPDAEDEDNDPMKLAAKVPRL